MLEHTGQVYKQHYIPIFNMRCQITPLCCTDYLYKYIQHTTGETQRTPSTVETRFNAWSTYSYLKGYITGRLRPANWCASYLSGFLHVSIWDLDFCSIGGLSGNLMFGIFMGERARFFHSSGMYFPLIFLISSHSLSICEIVFGG